MKLSLLNKIVCPDCKSELAIRYSPRAVINNEVSEGELLCDKCHKIYLITNYVPRFVESDKYAGNFSFEWSIHTQTQLDSLSGLNESETMFYQKTGINLEDLEGKLVLDVGCGAGRYIEIVNKYGGEVIGIDLSYAVDVAFNNLGLKDNIHIIQADIFNLPFKEETFDYILSIGVLHHTPNTRQAFECLPRLLKHGGEIAIWVYSNEGFPMKIINLVSSLYRVITTRIPKQMVYQFARLSAPLYYPKKNKFIKPILTLLLPTSTHPVKDWRILDTFDWYSPKYQWKHTHKEVMRWFWSSGLSEVKRADIAVSVKGKKC